MPAYSWMTMLQPSRVLPSNAPPLQDGSTDDLHQASRVLQEHSGNRQQYRHHDYGTAVDWEQTKYEQYEQQKYPANVLTGENAYARHAHIPQHQHQHLYHPQPQHRYAYKYGGYRGPYGQIDEVRVQHDAERLYRRFRDSEQYRKYRERQAKEDKGNGDQKWPDHLEKAFFRALITYPPMGRRKQLHKEKQRGRNELIADCIEELTGEARTRKQVSSHIQVLKPFVEHDKHIMKWLSKDDMMAQSGRIHGHSYPTGRRMSNYPVTAPPHSLRSAMPAAPRTDALGVQQLKQSPQAFEPADFQMFIQRKYHEGGKDEKVDRLHTYSQAVESPLAADPVMPDWQTLARDFPQLAEANAQRPIDCTVLIAEASLAFPTEPMEKWKDREGASIELGIYFQCRSRQLPAPRPGMKSQVSLLNKFYMNGQEVRNFSEKHEIYFHHAHDGAAVETEIKFGSQFWAKTLSQVGNKLRDPHEMSQQQRDEQGEYVRLLSALQEVYVASDSGPERIAIIHWNFRLSSSKCGRASWRRLILPDSSSTTGIYTAPPPPSLKNERTDSFYDYTAHIPDMGTTGTQDATQQHPPPLPTLQSPFEYDASSSGGSALSSATWPTSISDGNTVGDFGTDNNFDFNAGNIKIAYDPSSINFDAFDSSAFNLDDTTAIDVDFAADPNLQDFSQQTWYDNAFDNGTAVVPHGLGLGVCGVGVDEHASFATQPTEFDDGAGQGLYATGYENPTAVGVGQYDEQQAVFAAPTPQQGQHQNQQQAYGGAGPEFDIKEEHALATLADASAWARGLGREQ